MPIDEPLANPPAAKVTEDKRLERLYDYTKFHIGIYLSVAASLVTLIGLAAKSEEGNFLSKLVGSPLSLVASAGLMFFAGVAGAIVASSSTECKTYEELWENKQGPCGLHLLSGRSWAAVEHTCFWLSAIFFVVAIATAPAVRAWLAK